MTTTQTTFVYECCDATEEHPFSETVTCFFCGKAVQPRSIEKIRGITPSDLNPDEVGLYSPVSSMNHLMYEVPDGTT